MRHSDLLALYVVLFTVAQLVTKPKTRNLLERPKNNELSLT
jgi:hypothetical protein